MYLPSLTNTAYKGCLKQTFADCARCHASVCVYAAVIVA